MVEDKNSEGLELFVKVAKDVGVPNGAVQQDAERYRLFVDELGLDNYVVAAEVLTEKGFIPGDHFFHKQLGLGRESEVVSKEAYGRTIKELYDTKLKEYQQIQREAEDRKNSVGDWDDARVQDTDVELPVLPEVSVSVPTREPLAPVPPVYGTEKGLPIASTGTPQADVERRDDGSELVEQLKAQIKTLEERVIAKGLLLNKKSRGLADLEKRYDVLTNEFREVNAEHLNKSREYGANVQELKEQLSQAENKKSAVTEQLAALEQKYNNDTSELSDELGDTNAKLAETGTELESLRDSYSELEDSLRILSGKNDDLSATADELIGQVDGLNASLKQKDAELERVRDYDELVTEKDSLAEELRQSKVTVKGVFESKGEVEADYEARIGELGRRNDELQLAVEDNKLKFEEAKALARLQNGVIKGLRKEHHEYLKGQASQLKAKELELKNLAGRVLEKERDIQNLDAKLKQFNGSLRNAGAEIRALTEEVAKQDSIREELQRYKERDEDIQKFIEGLPEKYAGMSPDQLASGVETITMKALLQLRYNIQQGNNAVSDIGEKLRGLEDEISANKETIATKDKEITEAQGLTSHHKRVRNYFIAGASAVSLVAAGFIVYGAYVKSPFKSQTIENLNTQLQTVRGERDALGTRLGAQTEIALEMTAEASKYEAEAEDAQKRAEELEKRLADEEKKLKAEKESRKKQDRTHELLDTLNKRPSVRMRRVQHRQQRGN